MNPPNAPSNQDHDSFHSISLSGKLRCVSLRFVSDVAVRLRLPGGPDPELLRAGYEKRSDRANGGTVRFLFSTVPSLGLAGLLWVLHCGFARVSRVLEKSDVAVPEMLIEVSKVPESSAAPRKLRNQTQ